MTAIDYAVGVASNAPDSFHYINPPPPTQCYDAVNSTPYDTTGELFSAKSSPPPSCDVIDHVTGKLSGHVTRIGNWTATSYS